jgi:hypothetical protein
MGVSALGRAKWRASGCSLHVAASRLGRNFDGVIGQFATDRPPLARQVRQKLAVADRFLDGKGDNDERNAGEP